MPYQKLSTVFQKSNDTALWLKRVDDLSRANLCYQRTIPANLAAGSRVSAITQTKIQITAINSAIALKIKQLLPIFSAALQQELKQTLTIRIVIRMALKDIHSGQINQPTGHRLSKQGRMTLATFQAQLDKADPLSKALQSLIEKSGTT